MLMMMAFRSVILVLLFAAKAVRAQVSATVPPISSTVAPTPAPTEIPDKCKALIPGTVLTYVMNAVNPDQFALFPVDDVSPEVGSLFFTDNAYTPVEKVAWC